MTPSTWKGKLIGCLSFIIQKMPYGLDIDMFCWRPCSNNSPAPKASEKEGHYACLFSIFCTNCIASSSIPFKSQSMNR